MTNEERQLILDYYIKQRKRFIWTSHIVYTLYEKPRKECSDEELNSTRERRLCYEVESEGIAQILDMLKIKRPTDKVLVEQVKQEYNVDKLFFDYD